MIYKNLFMEFRNLGIKIDRDNMIVSNSELRRSNHKLAEQRRRDLIKKCFESIKNLLPNIEEKVPSKLHILEKTHEYILMLHDREARLKHELEKAVAKNTKN